MKSVLLKQIIGLIKPTSGPELLLIALTFSTQRKEMGASL